MADSRRRIGWFFNRYLLGAAVLGVMILSTVDHIHDTLAARAPYYVVQAEDDERAEKVTRAEFLNHNLTQYGLLLGVELAAWGMLAANLRDLTKRPNQSEKS